MAVSREQIMAELQSFLEQGNALRGTLYMGGFYGTEEMVDDSGYYAWRLKLLTFIRSIGFDIPEIVKGIKDEIHNYLISVERIQGYIKSLLELIEREYVVQPDKKVVDPDAELENLFVKFHKVARQLRSRHNSRETLTINDEYDVQDLLHAMLLLHFDDVRAEEWTPSYAGGAVRVDFLLKDCKTFVEVKKTRPSMTAKDLGEQLLIDREKYKAHPDCEKLYCFVYDPEGYLGNPAGIKRDLEKGQEDFLKVFIMPE